MYIICKELSYSYPGAPSNVFSGVNWSIKGPGFFSLFGLSGVGKSTLARIISGNIAPKSGKVTSGNGKILYSYDSERLPGWLSIERHLKKTTPAGNSALLEGLISGYGMGRLLRHRFSALSMGQKNRVNLIRYLVQDFELLITDEVLANVDEPTRYEILGSIKRLFPQKTFLYISHNAIEVARFSKTVYILPQASDGAPALIHEVTGLDQHEGYVIDDRTVQGKVYEILRTASMEGTMP